MQSPRFAMALLVVCACSTGGTTAEERAVSIRTTACGDTSRTVGSGVIVDDATVLTVAHVVVGATDVFVGDGSEEPATVVLLDLTRDLALLEAPSVDASPIELVELSNGAAVRVVGGAASGTVDAEIERRLMMDVDDVRRTTRSERAGYELDAGIAGGDSGAGVYDDTGRLAAIVFAVPTERSGATFAVGAAEIEAVLGSPDRVAHRCDPDRSQVVTAG